MDRTILTWAKHFRRLIKAAGPLAGTNILCREIFRIPKPITVSVGGYSLTLRPDNSDPSVAGKIFGAHEYDIGEQQRSRLNDLASKWKQGGNVPVIVDGGANVGYSSIFFANAYPDATVLAVEADEEAFALIQKNCAPFDRIIPISRSALVSR